MIFNRQSNMSISIPELRKFLLRVCKRLGLPGDSFTVALVSSSQMRRWNRMYRGKNQPTDVLSFPGDAPPRNSRPLPRPRRRLRFAPAPEYLGDVAIAPAVARENARRFGRTFQQELRILILHGILHLMGYDHEIDTGQMERRERRLRRELGLD